MDNQIGDNNECKKCLGLFFADCFYKLFDKKIMAVDRINLPFKKNTRLLIDLSPEQRKRAINSIMAEILNYNQNFHEICINYLLGLNEIPSRENLCQLIKNQYKYYYYKAIIIAIIKTLFILIQLIITIINFYPKYECLDSNSNILSYAILDLKLINFLFFDLFYIINEFYFFKQFERIKFKKSIVIFYQTIGYIFNVISYILIFFNNKNITHALKDDNVFSKRDNDLKNFIPILLDVIIYFIK